MNQNKVTLPLLFGIVIVGFFELSSNIFAEEIEDEEFITVNVEKVVKPQSVSNYQEITILGHVNDYSRGDNVFIVIINPDGTEEEISTYASKKGYLHIIAFDKKISSRNI